MTGLTSSVGADSRRVRVRRISEEMQKDEVLMGALRRAGAMRQIGHAVGRRPGALDPGGSVELGPSVLGGLAVTVHLPVQQDDTEPHRSTPAAGR